MSRRYPIIATSALLLTLNAAFAIAEEAVSTDTANAANSSEHINERLDRKGDRAERKRDRKGDRIERRANRGGDARQQHAGARDGRQERRQR